MFAVMASSIGAAQFRGARLSRCDRFDHVDARRTRALYRHACTQCRILS